MHEIQDNIGSLIAAETKGALHAIDSAILSELRLCTSLVEAMESTNLPIGRTQKLLQSMSNGLSHFVAGRGEMAHTVRTLSTIKSDSNLRETSYSCPGEPIPSGCTPHHDAVVAYQAFPLG
jgi:hypothetical protein